MNNNSNNNRGNNRRRGRGNRQQGGGGNQNRIDSRARGNAPQMLDKYRKLAQDAQHNDDRVQAEYYLQFADHYFRVIADSRRPEDQQRQQRRDERDFSSDEDGDEDEFEGARANRDERPREDRQREDRPREDRQRDGRQGRGDRNRGERQRQPRDEGAEGERANEGEAANEFEPAENPFIRPNRTRDNSRRPRGGRGNGGESEEMTSDAGEIDAAALPPSFSANAARDDEAEAQPATRKLPPRRRRKPEGEADEGDSLSAVG